MIFRILIALLFIGITVWIHKHTYGTVRQNGKYIANLDDRAPFPVWFLILMIIFLSIPIINCIIFVLGMGFWFMNCAENEIRLGNLSGLSKSIYNFLTRQL